MNADQKAELKQRRSRVMVTAWILAAVAVAIFATFILSGVMADK